MIALHGDKNIPEGKVVAEKSPSEVRSPSREPWRVRGEPMSKHRGTEYAQVQRGPRHNRAGQVTPVCGLKSEAQSL